MCNISMTKSEKINFSLVQTMKQMLEFKKNWNKRLKEIEAPDNYYSL